MQGLKGTGSYDYTSRTSSCPQHRTFRAVHPRAPPRHVAGVPDGLHAVTAAGHARGRSASPRACSTTSQELAATKYRMGDMASLASRPTFQKGLAHHVAVWRAARLLVLDAFTTAEAAVASGERADPGVRADMRVAAVFATDAARELRRVGPPGRGHQSIREGSRLERAFRDMYTGTQHAFISEKVAIDGAQVWLGLIEDHFGL